MPAAAVVAVAGIASSAMQAKAAKSAAATQARSLREASALTAATAAQAKEDILNRMVPALNDYGKEIAKSQQAIASGTADIMNILQTSTGQADRMLTSVGANAKQALLGSTATSQGIPRQQFLTSYNQSQLPATGTAAAPAAPATGGQTYEQTLTGITGLPELTRDTAGNLGTVEDVRAATMAGLEPRQTDSAAGQSALGQQALTSLNLTGELPATGAVAETPSGIGFAGAQQQLQRGEDIGLQALTSQATQARGDILAGTEAGLGSIAAAREGAIADYAPYTQAGAGAIEQEAALSGALGPEAQQAAINSFIESPGQKYLREQQEKALLRSSAATGGLGGGRVRSALMEQAMGIAATQQQQQLENLRSIASRGQTAAGDVAGIRVGTGTTEAGIQTGAGQQLAQIANSLGLNVSQLINATSAEKAALAERMGINLSQLEQAIGSARVAGIQGLGSSLASTVGGATGDIAGLIERGGTTTLSAQQNLASTLGNIAVGAGSQQSEYTAGAGSALAAGQLASGQALAQGIQGLGNVAAYGIGSNYSATPQMPIQMQQQLGIYG